MSDAPPGRPTLGGIADFLAEALGADAFPPEERGGVFRDGDGRPLERLGVALEPWPGLAAWAAAERLDALFLHRPWRLPERALADGVGVVWSHLPFDERLTTGLNPRLAAALGLGTPAPLGTKDGRTIGMVADGPAATAAEWVARVAAVFGGTEAVLVPSGRAPVSRVAVVGAMTDALVREAAERGAGLYVTGQLRHPGRVAAAETGMAVAAVGHARSERWGVRALRHLLAERWGALRVVAPAVVDEPVPGESADGDTDGPVAA